MSDCSNLKEVVFGNNCQCNGAYTNTYFLRSCTSLSSIKMGDNCSFYTQYAFRYSGVPTINITCGKNTSIELRALSSATKILNIKENTSFDCLSSNNLTVNGNLKVNSGTEETYKTLNIGGTANIDGNLIVGNNVNVHGQLIINGNATLGNKINILEGDGAFRINTEGAVNIGSVFLNNYYGSLKYGKFPSKLILDPSSTGIGADTFTKCIGLEYLIITPNSSFKCGRRLFFDYTNMKAVVVNLSDNWTKDDFTGSIGGNIDSRWLSNRKFFLQ